MAAERRLLIICLLLLGLYSRLHDFANAAIAASRVAS
jgi:hypothetical protein